jgi:arylsulfatase A-like enzyme
LPARRIEGAAIQDIVPTVLHAMSLPVPTDMDGQVLEEAFAEGYMVAYPLQIMEPSSPSGDVDEVGYTEEGDKGIMELLQQF